MSSAGSSTDGPGGIDAAPPRQADGDTRPPRRNTPSLTTNGGPRELRGQFGRYRVVRALGRGGMGSVYLAEDLTLERQVALKVPHIGAGDSEFRERFVREARAAATLSHPNICAVYDVGEIEGTHYIAMEYVDGKPLAHFVNAEPRVSERQAAGVVRKLALALDEAHRRGIVHRDLKPANVMINRRREPVIMDFGLARRVGHEDARITRDGALVGTPAYMAPEQVTGGGEAAGPSCDVYGLGMILYELLTGSLPFEGPTAVTVLGQVLTVPPEPPSQRRPGLAPELEAICLKALAKKPEDRFASMSEFAAALTDFLRASGGAAAGTASPSLVLQAPTSVTAAPAPAAAPSGGGSRRRRAALAATGMGAAALLGVVIYITTRQGTTRIEVDDPEAVVRVERDPEPEEQEPPKPAPPAARELPTPDDAATVPVPPFWVDVPQGREAVPPAEQIDETERAVLEELTGRLVSEKPDDRKAVAEELIKQAAASVNQPVDRFARLRLARQVAAEAGEYGTALEACDRLATWYAVDTIRMKAAVLTRNARFAKSAGQFEALAKACHTVGFEAVAREDYRYATALAESGREAAAKGKLAHLVDEANFLAEEAAAGEAGFESVRADVETLRAASEAPKANARVGRFLCLVKSDWGRGLPMLARGDDAGLKGVAAREAARPSASEEQIRVGDAWWDLAESAAGEDVAPMRRRARYWYLKGLATSKGTTPEEVARRVLERTRAVPTRSYALKVRLGGTEYHHLRISADGIESVSTKHSHPWLRANRLDWHSKVVPQVSNSGATRVLPDDIDFTSADVRIVSEKCAYGRLYGDCMHRVAEDHVSLHMGHWPIGACDTEVLVTFHGRGAGQDALVVPTWQLRGYKYSPKEHGNSPDMAKVVETEVLETRETRAIAYAWEKGAPAKGMPADHFAIVGTARVSFPGGKYRLRWCVSDGLRVYVDDLPVIDLWKVGVWEGSKEVEIAEGEHSLRLEYFAQKHEDFLGFWIVPLGRDTAPATP